MTGGTTLTISGTALKGVKKVTVAGVAVWSITKRSDTKLVVVTASTKDYRTASGAVKVWTPTGTATSSKKFSYRVKSRLDKQISYALKYVHQKKKGYLYFKDNNCMNYVSQTLKQRGWKNNSTWYYRGGWKVSKSFVNVEYFWHEIHKKKYRQKVSFIGYDSQKHRAKLQVGDLVFADWNTKKKSGRKYNHIMVVSKITTDNNGHIKVYMSGNTRNQKYRDLDRLVNGTWNYYRKDGDTKHRIRIKSPDFYFVHIK